MHLVLRSDTAIGQRSFRKPAARAVIISILHRWAKRYGIKIYKYSVNSNHLHLAIQATNRRLLQNFLRVFAGQLAIALIKMWKASPLKVWSTRIYTRIIASFDRPFAILLRYIDQNILEAGGTIQYKPRPTNKSQKRY
ncbi:MAG: transposase [Deltaproteobacteria bacterium]|nr:transposase [Deltaproteobacteria bacterium]